MQITNSLINPSLAYTLCFIGGYTLNYICLKTNRFAVKHFSLPIGSHGGEDDEKYAQRWFEKLESTAKSVNISTDRALGNILFIVSECAIREEITYRFLLENIVLPCISSHFAVFSIERSCISSFLFAAAHLHNSWPTEVLAGQFLNTVILGLICSFAQERIGLLGSVLIHVGYNLHAWQYTYKQNLKGTFENIKAVHLTDRINTNQILFLVSGFISDAIGPFILTYRTACKVKELLMVNKKAGDCLKA